MANHYRNTILLIAICFASQTMRSQTGDSPFCVPDRFGNQYVFTANEVVVNENIEFALSQNAQGEWEQQLMDIYYPNPNIDTLTARPLAIVIHGGGFKNGDKSDNLVVESMMALARSGYTAATFNYRLGYDELGGPCSADPEDIRRAVYRALQDSHSAMRYLFHYQDQYGIDTSYVFAGGISAGATLASLLHYTDYDYFNENFQSLLLELGPINTSGNGLDDEFKIDGLIMAWGSFPTEVEIDSNNAIPAVIFHGALDETVPIGEGNFGSCPNYPITIGPDLYAPMMDEAGVCYDFNRSTTGTHNVDMYGEFYIKNRTMCFMKSVFCDECEQSTQEQASAQCPTLGATPQSLHEFEKLTESIQIVPNPSSSTEICLINNYSIATELVFEIVTAQGMRAEKFAPILLSSNERNCLRFKRSLNPGTYLLKISDPISGSVSHKKLVIK